MPFQIHALPAENVQPLFALGDDALAQRLARRVVATGHPGFPCRVSLRDAAIGEELLLLNHMCQDAASPYRATHAIFVRRDAVQARPAPGEVPASLARRLLSLRAFDAAGMMMAGEVVPGETLAAALAELLAAPEARYVHIHSAKRGCYHARADRA